MKQKIIESLGWLGVALVVGAYGLVSIGVLAADSFGYQIANLAGAVFLIGSSWDNRDWQPIILNVIWAWIAIIGLVRSLL